MSQRRIPQPSPQSTRPSNRNAGTSQPDSQTTGIRLLLTAVALMLIASIFGALIQTGYLPHNSTTETIGFISYLCVALPIIPGVIATAGFILLAQSRK